MPDFPQIGFNALQKRQTQLLVRHLATAKTQSDFAFVAIFQKRRQIADLDVVVAIIRTGTELDFLHPDDMLLQLRCMRFLGLLVLELAIIHDLAHRRLGLWSDLDEIDFKFFGFGEGLANRDDTNLLVIRANQTYFRYIDLAVDTDGFFGGYGLFSWIINELSVIVSGGRA